MRQNETFSRQKNAEIYICEKCDFTCSKKCDWDRHNMTRKHKSETNETDLRQKNAFTCETCLSKLKSRASYYRHKQKCGVFSHEKNAEKTPDEQSSPTHQPFQQNNALDKDNIIIELLQQNKEMMHMLSKANQVTNNNNNNMNNNHNTTNSHNKTFNLQFFFNETCKDAMNITDFVNSLKLSLHDLEKVGELGYAEGISRMFVKGLNDLEVTKRPIHCSDIKREILHIKDKDKWEKDANRDKLTKAIKDLSNKNIMLLDDWQKENPGCKEYNNRKNDIYLKLMVESLGPADDTAEKRDFGKIIRTIAKSTIIDRDYNNNIEN